MLVLAACDTRNMGITSRMRALSPVPLMPTLWQGRWAGGGIAFAGESVDPRGPALAGLPEGARLRDGIPCWRRPSGAPEAP
eukprot:COSAG01_NODE_239_length_20670_cov_28.609790_9_plen_81_part_00